MTYQAVHVAEALNKVKAAKLIWKAHSDGTISADIDSKAVATMEQAAAITFFVDTQTADGKTVKGPRYGIAGRMPLSITKSDDFGPRVTGDAGKMSDNSIKIYTDFAEGIGEAAQGKPSAIKTLQNRNMQRDISPLSHTVSVRDDKTQYVNVDATAAESATSSIGAPGSHVAAALARRTKASERGV